MPKYLVQGDNDFTKLLVTLGARLVQLGAICPFIISDAFGFGVGGTEVIFCPTTIELVFKLNVWIEYATLLYPNVLGSDAQ